MSSYFDKAAVMFQAAMIDKNEIRAGEIAQTVLNTYGTYLAFISKRLAPEALQRATFDRLKEKWTKLIARPLIDDMDRAIQSSWLISDIHDFAHVVGSSGLRRRDGRPFLDNPYVAVMTDTIIEAQRRQ